MMYCLFVPNRTDCLFSPDDRLIVTGTSVTKTGKDFGQLVFFDRQTMARVAELDVAEHTVIVYFLNQNTIELCNRDLMYLVPILVVGYDFGRYICK